MISNHFTYTSSDVAEGILQNWDAALKNFVKVMPSDYKAVLQKRKEEQMQKELGAIATTADKEVVVNG